MVDRSNIARWLAVPARTGATRGNQPGMRLLAPAAVIAVAIAVTAAAALGAGRATGDASAAQTAMGGKSEYLQPVGVLVQHGTLPEPTTRGDDGNIGVPPRTPARTTPPVDPAVRRSAARYAGRPGTLTPAGIATLALQRGCSSTQAVVATAVAMAESGGSPSAQGDVSLMDSTWDWSAGLWQIRGLRVQRGTGALRDAVADQNAVPNSVAMYAISGGCTNWVAWSTYNDGAYRSYLGVATRAVDYVVDYYQVHHRYPAVAPPDPNATVPVPAGGYAAAPAPAAAAGGGTSARSPAAAGPRSSSSRAAADPGSGAASGAGSTAAAGGAGNGGAGDGDGPGPVPSTPGPVTTTPKDPATTPVGSASSAVGGVTGKVESVLPNTTCVPLVDC